MSESPQSMPESAAPATVVGAGKPWRGLWLGLLAGAGLVLLLGIFVAYQQPDLLLDWLNLRYCG